MNDWIDLRPDPAHVAREREKARQLRQTEWWRQQLRNGVCHYCGRKVGEANLTMDHVIPVARGGRSVRSNVVPACDACNKKKRFYTPAELILAELEKEQEQQAGQPGDPPCGD
ncbi:MAG: HNH endonuclease [Kiritimatiellae bacterium]|nr:HNH endonuclease [Kiritimatiellia bacterium]